MKQRIENTLCGIAVWCYKRNRTTLLLALFFMAVLASRLAGLTIDTSTESFFHADDPTIGHYDKFRATFGRDDIIILAIEPESLFDRSVLEKIRGLHRGIEDSVPYIDEVTSVVNVRQVRGEGDRLIVENLLEKRPETDGDMALFREKLMTTPYYRNTMVSGDGRFTTIVVKLATYSREPVDTEAALEGFDADPAAESAPPAYLSDAQNAEVVTALKRLVKAHEAPDFKIYMAGTPVVDTAVKGLVAADMQMYMGGSICIIICVLFILFRRPSAIVTALGIAVSAMVSVLGVMAWCGISMNIVTQILISFILVTSIADAIHILVIFYLKLDGNQDRESALRDAMAYAGLPVMFTSLTTAGGLVSFAWADVSPVADFGIMGAVGALFAFFYTIVLVPAFVGILPIRPKKRKPGGPAGFTTLFEAIARVSCGHPHKIAAVSTVIIAISLVGVGRIHFSHNILEWLPRDSDVRIATEMIDENLGGSVSAEVIIDTGQKNGFHDPVMLKKLGQAGHYLEGRQHDAVFVGKAWSVADILKEIHKALNENSDAFYHVPEGRDLVAQELLLFENSGSDDLEEIVTPGYETARLTLKSPFSNAMDYAGFLEEAEAYFTRHFPDADVVITGIMALFAKTFYNLMMSMGKSYVIAFAVVSLLMVVLIGKNRLALLCIIPNIVPILAVMGFMGLAGIDLDSSNMLIGSIAIGLIVDDTIHFMNGFNRHWRQTGDTHAAVRQTLLSTGRAMMTTSLVLALGFLTYAFSSMRNVMNFGLLTALVILLALMVDFFLMSALLKIVKKPGLPAPEKQNQQAVSAG